MTNPTQFMVVHKSPELSWEQVEKNWAKLACVKDAKWLRTYYNKDENLRFCVWLAEDKEKLQTIFSELDIRWESISMVEETVPDVWSGYMG